jgi:hypothetical protein
MDIKTRGAARARMFGQRSIYERDILYVRQAFDRGVIQLDHRANRGLGREDFDRHFYFGLNL